MATDGPTIENELAIELADAIDMAANESPTIIAAEHELDYSQPGDPVAYVRLTTSRGTYVAVLHAGDVPPPR